MVDVSNEIMLQIQKQMAWQRAKGELRSIGECFYASRDMHDEWSKAVETFIRYIEDDGVGGFT